MSFEQRLREQAALHPALAPRDAIKLCYQAAHGAEHLLTHPDKARALFIEEFDRVLPHGGPLVEHISPVYARVNLAVWKHRGLPPDTLFDLFRQTTASPAEHPEQALSACFEAVDEHAVSGLLPFTQADWRAALETYRAAGGGPMRHSESYREKEQPHYRVVRADLLPPQLLQL